MRNTASIHTLRLMPLLLAAAWFSACTERIDLDLKSAEPKPVIEAVITDAPGPYYVYITASKAYYEDNSFNGLLADLVVISDDAGNTDTLVTDTAQPGVYVTSPTGIQGVPGRTYTLQISLQGKLYTAISYMPMPIEIDTLYSTELTFAFNNDDPNARQVEVVYTDPKGVGNFYRVESYKNGLKEDSYQTASDRLTDGTLRDITLDDIGCVVGDTVTVHFQCISEPVYNYFNVLNGGGFGGGAATSTAPANPVTNIAGGDVLGYFSAHTLRVRSLVVGP